MVRALVWCFVRALVIYPPAFRARFGPAMMQAFHDGLVDRRGRLGRVSAARFALRGLANHLASGLAERRYERRRDAPARSVAPFRAIAEDVRFATRMMRRQRGVMVGAGSNRIE